MTKVNLYFQALHLAAIALWSTNRICIKTGTACPGISRTEDFGGPIDLVSRRVRVGAHQLRQWRADAARLRVYGEGNLRR